MPEVEPLLLLVGAVLVGGAGILYRIHGTTERSPTEHPSRRSGRDRRRHDPALPYVGEAYDRRQRTRRRPHATNKARQARLKENHQS